jgi:hypothetical protein
MRLTKIVPPRLPDPTPTYQGTYLQALLNVLRLYFNRLTDNVNNLLGVNGGRFVECPNGLFYDLSVQAIAAPNTAQVVAFGQTYLNNAVSVASGDRLTTSIAGVYNFQFHGQAYSSSASSKNVFVWLRKNGADIQMTTQAATLTGSGEYKVLNYAFDMDMQAGDYIQFVWASSATGLELHTVAAAAAHPGIPSAVVTVNFISPLPDVLPTPP